MHQGGAPATGGKESAVLYVIVLCPDSRPLSCGSAFMQEQVVMFVFMAAPSLFIHAAHVLNRVKGDTAPEYRLVVGKRERSGRT